MKEVVGKIPPLTSGGICARGPPLSESKSDEVKATNYFSSLYARPRADNALGGVCFLARASGEKNERVLPEIKDKKLNTRKDRGRERADLQVRLSSRHRAAPRASGAASLPRGRCVGGVWGLLSRLHPHFGEPGACRSAKDQNKRAPPCKMFLERQMLSRWVLSPDF